MPVKKKANKYNVLCKAIKKGQKETARKLILKNATVNATDSSTNTPLHWAIANFDDTEVMQMLLDKGADIHALNQFGQTPLFIAIEQNKAESVKLLLSKGADNGVDISILIYEATKTENEEILKLLLGCVAKTGESFNLKNAVNLAAKQANLKILQYLIPICEYCDLDDKQIPTTVVLNPTPPYKKVVQFLLQHEFTVDPQEKTNWDLLVVAISEGYIKIIENFLNLNINVNMINKLSGLSMIHIACLYKRTEIVQLLIAHGANVNVKISNNYIWYKKSPDNSIMEVRLLNRTSLYISTHNCDVTIIKLLLSNGADIRNEPYLLHNACQVTCKEIIEILVKLKSDVNVADKAGGTPLYYCITPYTKNEDWDVSDVTINDDITYEIAELLLNKGANPNSTTNKSQLTPLFAAVAYSFVKTVKLLLQHNIDIHHVDSFGNTALHFAASTGNEKIMQILLNHNFDVNIKNREGFTPLHVASEKENSKLIELLLKNNANLNAKSICGITPFHWACRYYRSENVELFIKYNVNVNSTIFNNNTALHVLAECKPIIETPFVIQQIIKTGYILLKNNANIFAEDDQGIMPIFSACMHGNMPLLIFLLRYITTEHSFANAYDRIKNIYGNIYPLISQLKNLKNKSKIKEIIKILPDFYTKVCFTNKDGETLLHTAAKSNFTNAFQLLLQYNIDINSMDNKDRTVLHYISTNLNVVLSLLKYGADINLSRNNADTPLEYVMSLIRVCRQMINYGVEIVNNAPGHEYDKDELCYLHTFIEAAIILKKHAIKLKMAKIYISEANLKVVYGNFFENVRFDALFDIDAHWVESNTKINVRKLETACAKEIEKLKQAKIIGNMSFYDFMRNNIHGIAKLTTDINIKHIIKSDNVKKQFPIYYDVMYSRFMQGIARCKLENVVEEHFIANIFNNMPRNCLNKILSYFDNDDLKSFINNIAILKSISI